MNIRAARPSPGFTLLEVMLASVIGALVLGVCVAMFSAIGRADDRMSVRFDQALGLERARVVVGRAMDSLVMSTEPIPTGGDTRAIAGREASAAQPRPLPAARFIVEPDPSETIERLVRQARISGQNVIGGLTAPQRVEVTLLQSPVPNDDQAAEGSGRRAIRGMFEVRPDRMTPPGYGAGSQAGVRSGQVEGWTLWWRPLPADGQGLEEARAGEPTRDRLATPIVSGLSDCTWTVYRKRERRKELKATWALDLPAYVELKVTTTSGITAHWMFEVGWTNSPEIIEEAVTAEGEQPSAEGRTPAPATGTPAGGVPRAVPQEGRPNFRRDGRGKG